MEVTAKGYIFRGVAAVCTDLNNADHGMVLHTQGRGCPLMTARAIRLKPAIH